TKEHPMAASDFLAIYRNAPPEEVETMLRDGRLKVDPGFDFALYNRDAQAKRQAEEDRRAALDGMPEEEPIQTVSRYLQENPGANNEDVVRLLDQGGLINDTMINFHQAAANDAMDRELESWHDQNDTDRQLVDHYLREEGYITPFLQEDGTMTINGEIVGFYDRKTGKKKWYEPMIVTIPAISDMLKMPGALMAYKTMPEEFDIIYQAVTRKDGPNKEDKEKLKKLSLYLNNILYDINLNGEEVTPEMRTAANAMQDIINAIPLNDSFPLSFLQRLNMMGGSALDSVRNLSAQTISKATGLDGSDYYAARASAYRGGASYKIDNGFVRFMIDRGIDAAQSALILAAVGSDPTLSKLAMAGNTATETAYAVKLAGGSDEQQQMAAFVGGLAEFIFYQAPSFGGEDVLEKTLTKKLKNLDSDLSEAAIKRLAQASAMTILENKNQGYSKERSMEELQKALLDALGDVVEDFIH
ncbi:hypothetical protein, partial [Akkermansia muciniphila]|uniref:hypothetical protein n=1 Tax=Akkermansia muciniphila TaxID=239935 RepID=UPI00195F9152